MAIEKESERGLDIRKHIIEVHCPKCGKIFVPAPFHVYKDNRGYYCTWSCYNHRNDGLTPSYRKVGQYTLDGELVRVYQSANQAGEFVRGIKPGSVRKACETGTELKGYLWRYEDDETIDD